MLKAMTDSLQRLYEAVTTIRGKDSIASRTGRLLRAGKRKIAKEAAEVALEAAAGRRQDVIRESADLLYHIVVLWADAKVQPKDVWAEMDRREKLMGIAEKMPKNGFPDLPRDKAPIPLERRRAR